MSDDEEEYIVEKIVGWRYNLRDKCREYFIKWKDYDDDVNTWEPEEHLNCQDILSEFVSSLRGKQRLYHNSERPDKLTGFQRNRTYLGWVGADGPHDSDDEDSPKEDKQKFYCLVTFDDSDYAEEVTIKEFLEFKPAEAFDFLEKRLLGVPSNKSKQK